MYNVYCHYIDSCYPDYLSDHHDRDNEQLICASFIQENKENLIVELLDNLDYRFDKVPDSITTEEIEEAIKDCIDIYSFESICKEDIDLEDEKNEDLLDEYEAANECYVYAYLTWEEDDDLKRVYNTSAMRTIEMSSSTETMYKFSRTMSSYHFDYEKGSTFVVDTDAAEYFWLIDEGGNKIYVPLEEKECFSYC